LILFSVAFYAFFAFRFQTIAKKTGTANRWMAWIPILNLILIFSIAERSAWWIILYFVPFVNLFIWVNIWIEIAELLEKPKWIGSLMIFPGINIFALAYLAFT